MSRTLDQLHPGESARIAGLLLGGLRRRRLLDLGFVPGMSVETPAASPSRNKKAPFCPSSEAEWRFLRFGK